MKLDLGRLRGNPDAPLLVLDLFMVLLVLFNLAWLLFDALFASHVVQSGIAWLSPAFHGWYRDEIHPDFLEYDLAFVAIYVTELLFRWALAIWQRSYHRWFFYPFVHWYDVLGCIPLGSFRWLRILRVVSLLWRLQRYGVIDLRQTWLVRTARKYLDVITEEIADRVVLNVLDGVRDEVARGNPVVHRIGREVLAPRREPFVAWLAHRLQQAGDAAWTSHRDAAEAYIGRLVAEGLRASPELRRLGALPVVGPSLAGAIDDSAADIARTIVAQLARDLADPASHPALQAALDSALAGATGDDARMALMVRESLLDAIDIVRQQVAVQQWKQREAAGHYD